jgi:hypothetical protein
MEGGKEVTNESIGKRLIEAAENYMQECIEESVFNGRLDARAELEQLAQEVEDRITALEARRFLWIKDEANNIIEFPDPLQRESLWRELDKAWDGYSRYNDEFATEREMNENDDYCNKIQELRRKLGLGER